MTTCNYIIIKVRWVPYNQQCPSNANQ